MKAQKGSYLMAQSFAGSHLSMFPATAVLFGLCCLLDFLGFVSTSNLVSNFLHWILCIVCKFDFTALSQDPTPNGHSS